MSISAPTDTKKIATNMSFMGLDRIFETSEDLDSATKTPAKNAPMATESPTTFAKSAYPKQTPRTLSSKISLFCALATLSIKGGITRLPIVNVPIKSPLATSTTKATVSMETVPTKPTDSRDAIRITAITSSTIKIPKTSMDDSFFIFPESCKILIIIAVLLIDNAAAINNESIKFRPKADAARKTTPNVTNRPNVPAPTATLPIERIFANGNSMPMTKSNKITPMSAKRFNADMSDRIPIPATGPELPFSGRMDVHNGERGPINIPANRYPIIKGCRILKNASVTIAARIIMIARSVTKVSWGSCKGLTLSTNEETFSLRED